MTLQWLFGGLILLIKFFVQGLLIESIISGFLCMIPVILVVNIIKSVVDKDKSKNTVRNTKIVLE
jgi:hypothetical protein